MATILRRGTVVIALVSVLLFRAAQPGQAQQPLDLGRADPRDAIAQISRAIVSGNMDAIRPWLSPRLFTAILLNEDFLQAFVRDLGPVDRIEVVARRQIGRMSYFELKVVHRLPSLPPNTPIAAIGETSYWLIEFNGATNVIDTLSFRRAAPFNEPARGNTTYVDAETAPVAAAAIAAVQTNETKDPRSVQLLFATTRRPGGRSFSEERSDTVNFGQALVRIPEDHNTGNIELPNMIQHWFAGYEEKLDRSKYFIIDDVGVLRQDDWNNFVRNSGKDEALIFIHGYNTTFDEALYRAAQVIWDLKYNGIPVLFSWASWGGAIEPVGLARSYAYDRDSALIDGDAFLALIHTLKATLGIKKVSVIAHSMGNFMLLSALKAEAQRPDPARLGELVMAAPDVDRRLFAIDVKEVQKIVAGMTLYASSADRALLASKEAARNMPRAGDVPSYGPVELPGIDTIDVTALGDEMFGLNHDYFASKRSLIDDISGALEGHRPPSSRMKQIHPVPESPPPPLYWRYVPQVTP